MPPRSNESRGARERQRRKNACKIGALLRTKRDYTEALRCFEDSLVVRLQLSGKEADEIASSYFDLGSVHDLLNADKKAIFCYSESIRMYVAMDAEPKLSVAKALSNKAAIVMSKEDDDQRAMHIYHRALDVRRACLGPAASERPAVDLADIIWGQASIYDRMGEHEQALSYYEKCLACYQESVGHESSQVARCIQSISDSFLRGGHYTQAHDAVVEALRLREAIPGVPEEDIADSMLTLGTILFAWREYENALPYLERACSTLMRIRGKFHISVGSASYLLGAIYESMQDYEKAMSRLKDSLNARKRALGEEHIDVAKVLTLIGKVHSALGEPDSAVLCFEEALEIARKAFGSDSEEAAEYLLDLAAALVAEDETEKAKACVDDALRTFKMKQINNHVGVAKCSSIKAMIYEKIGNLDAAREWYMNSVKILDSLLPDVASKEFLDDVDLHDDYLELASTLFKFANVDDMIGDEREAINLYDRSIHLYRSLQGEDHLNVANVQCHMALMLGRHEQFEKAMDLLQDALRIRVKNLGKDHPDVATCLFAIGVAYDKNQEYDDAILTYQECMRIQKLEYGPESVEVATTLENYGIAKGNSNDLRGAVESWEEGLEIMMALGYDETNQLIINLAGHREIALLLLGESKADESEGAK